MAILGDGVEGAAVGEVAVVVLDDAGIVRRWSDAATRLLGHAVPEVCGRPLTHLLADPAQWNADASAGSDVGRRVFRRSSGPPIELVVRTARVAGPDDSAEVVLLSCPAPGGSAAEQGAGFLTSLFGQDRLGVVLFDTRLNVVRANNLVESAGLPPLRAGCRLGDVVRAEDAEEAEALLRRVLETGVPLVGGELWMRAPSASGQERSLSASAVRLGGADGRPTGVAAFVTDDTEQRRARRRAEVSHAASVRIGASLDVARTAKDIADVLVPAFADLVSVDIVEVVLEGEEPAKGVMPSGRWRMRRVAAVCATGPWPADLIQVGDVMPPLPDVPQARRAALHGDTILKTSRQELEDQLADPEVIRALLPEKGHSLVISPLFARGLLLGFVSAWRTERAEGFQQEDADLLFDIASRAALSVDNARRYTREHRAAVELQQRLLPRATAQSTAAESAGRYVPAGGGADISGDWFDVIPLSSLRVAFVVGDVVGHGLHAAATMGRLRTAIRTLAELELEPGELLIHLDDLVQQLADEAAPEDRDTIGATCLYALYDPITGTCALADAGHPPPAVIAPDGTVRTIEVHPGPPLGVGGMPFEVTTVHVEPGSILALYTDGLVERTSKDLDEGTRDLLGSLSTLCGAARALEDIAHDVVSAVSEGPPRDDMALLLARTHLIPAADTAAWQFPDDTSRVADARKAVARRLADWGLDDLAFTTELIVSELVTNAMRYAGGTVGLRLFHDDRTLVCEVTDASNTQPRLIRARAGDEGGRGLFLVAQLARRWGSRYHRTGKTIWAEQTIGAGSGAGLDFAGVWDTAEI
ncbi:serine phosphatase RsbU (regulator of sigma subunit)/PAS domain-containing protein/anti-sigma regulatory factor (Ser/Thr protein kinase) [Streptomyces sp. SAI-126]|uniref:SpoIIE family protein phosphatase n=1 Tax=Streptomyces sp. SAI-126 TaxID=3377732 RepID=UPI003C7D4EBC